MNKVYLDMTKRTNCLAICIEDTEIIKSGTTVYHMDSNDKNETYQQYADEYDIHFIFDDNIPNLSFYTVPQVDVFATDSEGGLIGSVGSMTDLQSDLPICYINKNKECFLIATSGKEFLETINNWKNNIKPYNEVIFYESKLEAEKELSFIDI
ncbi:Uncharacterised protein [uncultured Clostridium sp.]|uniref:hypothetical protein n=1 Tax=uncultured Clostridium sp. TaxID=59620 RepID=UPI0008219FC4|nr:hypothetical protein [uncultured Clostridium sp.]SCI81589.1 Uncharacterised protein [uncultured Clostridium sp.]